MSVKKQQPPIGDNIYKYRFYNFSMGLMSYFRALGFVGAVAGAIATGTVAYKHEALRARKIPLAFSEKTQIESDLEVEGKETGPITRFLTSTNDACMKVFEAYNKSQETEGKQDFAEGLRVASNRELSPYHYTLSDLLANLPQEADLVLSELKLISLVNDEIKQVNKNFDDAWTESHTDNYHYRPKIVTRRDSEGHVRSETKMERVYDDTTHSYWYHSEAGEAAASGLQMLISLYPNIRIEEIIPTASKTNPDGEAAANQSMEHPKERPGFDKVELLEIAGKWNSGATINKRLPEIYNNWDFLKEDLQKWLAAKQTVRDTSYKTNWRSDSGPTEYRVANDALDHGKKLSADAEAVFEGIDFVKENSPGLHEKIKNLVAGIGDADDIEEEIMDTAKNMYRMNFEDGFDVDRFRKWYVGLFALLGLVGGGLAGRTARKMAGRYCELREERMEYLEVESKRKRFDHNFDYESIQDATIKEINRQRTNYDDEREAIKKPEIKSEPLKQDIEPPKIAVKQETVKTKPIEDKKEAVPEKPVEGEKKSFLSRMVSAIFNPPGMKKPKSIIVKSLHKSKIR